VTEGMREAAEVSAAEGRRWTERSSLGTQPAWVRKEGWGRLEPTVSARSNLGVDMFAPFCIFFVNFKNFQ